MTPLEKAMETLIRDVSESYWCAQWFGGIEYQIWSDLMGDSERFEPDDLAAIKALSDLTGTWLVWGDTPEPVGVPLDEWRKRYASNPQGSS